MHVSNASCHVLNASCQANEAAICSICSIPGVICGVEYIQHKMRWKDNTCAAHIQLTVESVDNHHHHHCLCDTIITILLLVSVGLGVCGYRARQHAPLGHQLSHSGKGSIGQPARIEAFWPAMGDPYKIPLIPLQAATPRAASRGKKRAPRKRALADSPRQAQGAGPDSPRAEAGQEQSDMVDLQELGRPLRGDGGLPEKKSPAEAQLTRHLEYDILQCIAKNRPEVIKLPAAHPSP